MAYTLPALPYAYDALEPYMDARTVEIHYTKHHQGYLNNLNKALEPYPELQAKPIEALLRDLGSVPEAIRETVRNHGGGYANHNLYWATMAPHAGGAPTGSLAAAIDRTFGSFEAFKGAFSQAAATHFASGWAWLAVMPTGALEVYTTANHYSPLMQGNTPILVLDVWEHAYYLQYQNRRVDFIQSWWALVNWEAVARNYNAALR